jgi:hypothetical protein
MGTGAVITNVGRNQMIQNTFGAQISGTVSIIRCGSSGTTPAITNTTLAAAVGSYYGVMSGYPTYDTTNQKVTTRYFVPSTDLNGASLTEVGEFFSGSTPQGLFSRDVFTPISKSGSDEIAFIFVSQLI